MRVVEAAHERITLRPGWQARLLLLVLLCAGCAGLGALLVAKAAAVAALIALSALAGAMLIALQRPDVGLYGWAATFAAFPIARLEFRGVPVYVLDVAVALVMVALIWRGLRLPPLGSLVILYLLVWLPAWAYQIWTLGVFLEPTYGLARNTLAVAIFFVVASVVRDAQAARRLVAALACGTVVTSLIALAQAIPATKAQMQTMLLWLAPSFAPGGYRAYPDRAFALFAAATILSGFLATVTPLLFAWIEDKASPRRLLMAGVLALASLAQVATYSRQWVPALAVGLIVMMALRPRSVPRAVVIVAAIGALAWGALSQGNLDRAYLAERFSRLSESDRNVIIRLQRQQEFFEVAREEPVHTMIGRGFAGQDLVERNVVGKETGEGLREGVNDNVFLLEVFNHGILAGALYVAILGTAFALAVGAGRREGPLQSVYTGLAGALASAIALHFFDNYYSETVFMRAFLWVIVGAIVGLATAERLRRGSARGAGG